MKYIIIFSCAVFVFVAANNLRCYDCDGGSDCVVPHEKNVKTTLCSESAGSRTGLKKKIADIDQLDIEPRLNIVEKEHECFSLYYETGDETAGVYRGCNEKNEDLADSCEYLKERLKGGNITICVACSEDDCNKHDVGGGAAALTVSLGVVILNLILCMKVFNL